MTKISKNVDESKKALKNHARHAVELKEMIQTQPDGPAKEELIKVLKNAEKHVKDLQEHIQQGE